MQHNYSLGKLIPGFLNCLIAGLFSVHFLTAQPVLVKDVNPGPSPSGIATTTINGTLTINNTLYFAATDGVSGNELWKSDGTTAGTVLVKDINPGAGNSFPSNFTEVNGTLYFTANSSTGGTELYKSDGTAAGTVLVKDINPGAASADPAYLTNVNGTLFFAANDGTTGAELWKSDGTTGGTVLVRDMIAGPLSFFTSFTAPSALANANGTLFFTNGSFSGLYKSNGTTAGTVLVKNVPAFYLTGLNNSVYFMNGPGPSASVLWKSDGTDAGTVAVKTIRESTTSAFDNFFFLRNVDGTLYLSNLIVPSAFSATLLLWRSDGTTAGTVSINLGPAHRTTSLVSYEFLGNYFYYSTSRGAAFYTSVDDEELMRVSLTGGSSEMVKNIYPGTTPNGLQNLSRPGHLKAVGNTLYFNAYTAGNERELWKSDGTDAGTVLVADLNPAGSSTPVPLVGINGVLLFTAENTSAGRELWKYDPNSGPSGTTTLRINAGGEAYTASGRTFSADNYFTGGTAFRHDGVAIANTTDDELFRTERYGAFTYGLPVTNGSYTVTLHFAEIYFGSMAPGGVGSRKFNVDVEGLRRLTEFDIFAEAGGALTAIQKTYTVSVTDGTLNLNFIAGSANNPKVSAIEVTPNPATAIRINAGGAEYVGSGTRFSADAQFSGGTTFSNRSVDIANTTDDELYRTERYGAFSYNLPVTNGAYTVVLHFAEIYFGSMASGGVGSRKFNVDVEGSRKLTEFDIFAEAGGASRAIQKAYPVNVTDGTLNINFLAGSANNPKVSAIEVIPTTGAAVAAAGRRSVEGLAATVYPNPADERLSVQLPVAATAVRSTAIADAAGKTYQTNAHKITGEKELQFNVSGLRSGLYLLQVQTREGASVLKFMKR